MLPKHIFMFLSAFLLAQCSFGKSVNSSYEDRRDRLLLYVLRGLVFQADYIMERGEKLLKNVIDEASGKEDKSEALSQRIGELSNLVDKLETFKQNKNELSAWDEIQTKFSLSKELNAEWRDDPVLKDLLDKHGVIELHTEVDDNLMAFLDGFIEEADIFWDTLSKEEQEQNSKFYEWFKSFKAEEDEETKQEMFLGFYDVIP